MHTNVNLHDFRNAFRDLRPTNFSYDGLTVLFQYLEELEEELGQSIELDVIALCCDYQESCIEEINAEYSHHLEYPLKNPDDAFIWLSERTEVCGQTDDSIVFAQF